MGTQALMTAARWLVTSALAGLGVAALYYPDVHAIPIAIAALGVFGTHGLTASFQVIPSRPGVGTQPEVKQP